MNLLSGLATVMSLCKGRQLSGPGETVCTVSVKAKPEATHELVDVPGKGLMLLPKNGPRQNFSVKQRMAMGGMTESVIVKQAREGTLREDVKKRFLDAGGVL